MLWHHAPRPDIGLRIQNYGFLGVGMFFVLSGYLIVTLLLRERDAAGRISLRDFYARRTIRIFPIYYLLLAAMAIVYLTVKAGSGEAERFFSELPYFATYTSNWIHTETMNLGVLWSLAAEEQFYLLWPLVEKLGRPRLTLALLVAILGVNQLVNFGVTDPWTGRAFGSGFANLEITQATFTPIALGVVLAHALHDRRWFDRIARLLQPGWTPALFIAGIGVLLTIGPADLSGWPRLTVHLLMTLLLASLVVRERHCLAPVFGLRPIARLGQISYGMYLYHMWCITAVNALVARSPLEPKSITTSVVALIASVVLTAVVAEISFRLIEAPLLKLKKHFQARQRPAAGDDPPTRSSASRPAD